MTASDSQRGAANDGMPPLPPIDPQDGVPQSTQNQDGTESESSLPGPRDEVSRDPNGAVPQDSNGQASADAVTVQQPTYGETWQPVAAQTPSAAGSPVAAESPVTAQSSAYGQPTPLHQPSYDGRDQYGQDARYGQPQYGQAQHGQAQYGQPQYGQPQHGQTQYGPGTQFGQQQPPLYASPQATMATGSTRARKPRRAPGWTPLIATAAVVGLIAGGASAYAINLSQPFIAGSSPAVVQVEGANIDWTAVAEAVSNSVVSIQVSSSAGTGQGSGVVWDDQGHVVTNHHVVETAGDNGQIVVMIGNHAFPATLVGSDAATDLAVIQLDEIPDGLAAIARADSTTLEVGADVMAVGSPLGLSGSVTTGIVSALDRPVSTGQIEDSLIVTNAIQTSAPLNPGNSGGALVDAAGQLIGINSSIATLGSSDSTSGSIGIGFAIPVQLVENIATQIIDSGKVEHAYLGTSTTTGQAALSDGTAVVGADVKSVVDDSPAATAGIETDDLIVAINDKQITSSEHLVGTVRALKVGETASFTVIRGGQEKTFEVTMGVSPDLGG